MSNAAVPVSGSPSAGSPKAGKYLVFTLSGERYAVPVLAVREIIRLCPITPVATMPPHIRGVINLRGRVIPLIDLRVRFGLSAPPDHDRTCIIVTQVVAAAGGRRPYAVVVDGVEEVATYGQADLLPTPDFGGDVDVRFITGMAHAAEQVITLIDLETVAANDPLDALEPSDSGATATSPDTAGDTA
jgi:purine-binding chemotaxis protein CheW